MTHNLPSVPCATAALEPYDDARTIDWHYCAITMPTSPTSRHAEGTGRRISVWRNLVWDDINFAPGTIHRRAEPDTKGDEQVGVLPLAEAAAGYRAMDERRASKTLLRS